MQDGDFAFLHYYLQKGFELKYLLQLEPLEKMLMASSMAVEVERKEGELQAWLGKIC